ncbi:MAG TPA: hypothetical protein VFL57_17155 [Bryobacteraceae bacterium]|nr:hypothetical protein [Bryobacteraceae bacterium]
MRDPDFTSRWWEVAQLRPLLGPDAASARAVGHHFGPDRASPEFGFLAISVPPATHSVVVLRPTTAVITFGTAAGGLRVTRVSAEKPERVESMDLAGTRIGHWVVLFNIERNSTRSAVWFETAAGLKLSFLVTGLGPGQWDIWRDGWLVEHGAYVRPTAGALYFTGLGGMYFIRPAS